jgi:hypothetical protein
VKYQMGFSQQQQQQQLQQQLYQQIQIHHLNNVNLV